MSRASAAGPPSPTTWTTPYRDWLEKQAEAWRPYRTWVAFLLRVLLEAETGETGGTRNVGSRER